MSRLIRISILAAGAAVASAGLGATRCNSSWLARAYIDYRPTAAEMALAGSRAKTVFGVYRSGGAVKALFIRATPRPGLVLTVR